MIDIISFFCFGIPFFIEQFAIPLLFTISFVVFLWGLFLKGFVGDFDNHFKKRANYLMLYSVASIGFLFVITGLVLYAFFPVLFSTCTSL